MAIILDGTAGLANNATDLSYTGTLTGGTGVVNIGSGQVYKDASGNVGIGTSTPAAPLHVKGASGSVALIVGNTGETTQLEVTATSNIGATLNITDGGTNRNMIFSISGTERARIDSSGNLLVGKSSNVVTTAGVNIFPTGDIYSVGAGSTDFDNIRFYRNGSASTVGRITTTSTTTSYVTSSDYRLKNTIAPMTGALDKVALLKPCTYKWNVDGSDGQGFIAHELQEVVEGCVTGTKDAVETYTDEDGNEATRPVYQGIDTSFLVATLTAAIQEQQALITALTTRVTALEAANV